MLQQARLGYQSIVHPQVLRGLEEQVRNLDTDNGIRYESVTCTLTNEI